MSGPSVWCHACGEPLRQITSIASDPHDEPVLTCPCWPIDWPGVLLQIVACSLIVGLVAFAVWCKS